MTTSALTERPTRFPERRAAGRRLAAQLTGYRETQPVVVAVAPDGAPVAAEIAHALSAPLDTVAVALLTTGTASEGRFGVAAEGGTAFFDADQRDRAEAEPEAVDRALVDTEARLQRCTSLWHAGLSRPSLKGRAVLLVAESLIDERVAAAAACAVRDRGARSVVYVAPTAWFPAVTASEEWVDEIAGLELVDSRFSTADCYDDPASVSDETVRALLRENRNESRRHARE